MKRFSGFLALVLLVASCAKEQATAPSSPAPVVPEAAVERDVRLTLETPEGRAIDAWLTAQGFERCPVDQVIVQTDGVQSDIQIPYWNAVRKEKGVLERAITTEQSIFGSVVMRGTQTGIEGEVYVWQPAKGALVEVIRESPTPPLGTSLAPQKRFKQALVDWAVCWGGGVGGAALGCIVAGPLYKGCLGGAAISTTFSCGLSFWTSVL